MWDISWATKSEFSIRFEDWRVIIIGKSSPCGLFNSSIHADYLDQEIQDAIDAPWDISYRYYLLQTQKSNVN